MEQEIIKKAWDKYVLHHETIPSYVPGVRKEIIESWKRCQNYLDYNEVKSENLTREEYENKLKENALLIEIAYPYLENFVTDLEESEFMIMLTDHEGCMLKSLGSQELIQDIESKNNIVNGNYYDEKHCGTGGVGLTLATNQSAIVCGYEHYNQSYHNLVCYGATICDLNGNVIGSISITGYAKNYSKVILGMVKAAKGGIEKEFSLTRTNEILNSTINSMDHGVIVLDPHNYILYHNQKAEELLECAIEQKYSIQKYIQETDYLEKEMDNQDYTIHMLDGRPVYLVITVKQISNQKYLPGKIVIMESQAQKHRQIGLTAGFRAYHHFSDLKGVSPLIESLKTLGKSVSALDIPFIIYGEKGTEENILSEAIHNESSRKDNPFVKLDCSTHSNLLIELFGNNSNLGKIILANTGTLYLYEIGNMSLDLQKKFYSFMMTRELHDLNEKYTQKLDIRVIAYSSVDLASLVEKGQFDQKLYYALNTMIITIPPLRERKEDIPILVKSIILRNSQKLKNTNIQFDEESNQAIIHYSWPGNSRQLENIVESALSSTKNNIIKLSQLPVDIVNDYYSHHTTKTLLDFNIQQENQNVSKEMQEYNELLFGIKETNGDVKKAAQLLFIPVSTLYRKMKKYNINPKEYSKKNS